MKGDIYLSTTTKKILNIIKTLPEAKASLDVLVSKFSSSYVGSFEVLEVFDIYNNEITNIIHQTDSRFTNREIANAIIKRLVRTPFKRENLYSNDRRRLVDRLMRQEYWSNRKKIVEERLNKILGK